MSRLLGQKICSELSQDFSETFRYQFVLSPKKWGIPEFENLKIGRRHIYTSPLLNIVRIFDLSQNLLGVLLGQAVDQDGKYFSNVVLIDIGTDPQKAISKIHSFISDLAGRFIVFFNFKKLGIESGYIATQLHRFQLFLTKKMSSLLQAFFCA